jgi:putative NIF3 family GTP cyclohydrolase 1 type 2
MFGGVEAEIAGAADRPIARVAMARAMTAELVREAAAVGAHAYITGQLRPAGRQATAVAGLHLFAIGHRRSEAWGLASLAQQLRHRWPGLQTMLAPALVRGARPER